MTVLYENFSDISDTPVNGVVEIWRADPISGDTDGPGLTYNGRVFVTVTNGVMTSPDLDPGPARVMIRLGEWGEPRDIIIPDSAEPVQLRPLFAQYETPTAPVVSEAWQAARAAEAARDEAVATAATIGDIAEDVAQVAADRAAADASAAAAAGSASAAAGSATAAQTARTGAETAATAAAGDEASAASSAADAAADAAAAETARAAAVSARDTAVAAADSVAGIPDDVAQVAADRAAAETAATAAAGSATAAQTARTGAESAQSAAAGSASSAATDAGAASSARTGAETARDAAVTERTDAQTARSDAQAAASTATTKAAEAAQSAADAAASAEEASAGGVPPTRTISTGSGLTGGGDLSANRTIGIATGGVTADHIAVGGLPQDRLAASGALTTAINARQIASEKGQPSGYAGLGGDGKVPAGQLPATMTPSSHTHPVSELADATAFGRSLATAADAAAARTLLEVGLGETTTRVISYCNGGQGAPTASTITVNTQCGFRMSVKVPEKSTRWRVKLRNYSMLNGNKTAVTGKGVIFGEAAKVTTGTGTVSLTSGYVGNTASTIVSGDFTIPADGSWYTSAWVTASGDQFAPGREYLLGIAYQSAASLSVECSTGHCFMWTSTATALNPATNSGSTTPTGIPLDVVVEYECETSRESWLFVGDSIAEGVTGPRGTSTSNWTPIPVHRCYPQQWAARTNRLVTNISLSANRVAQFLTTNNPRFWSRVDMAGAVLDGVILSVGSNDFAADNRTLAQYQGDMASLVAQVRSTIGDVPIYYGAIIPRAQSATNAGSRRDANAWLASLPFGAAGFIDFDAAMRSGVDSDLSGAAGLLADMTTDNIHPSYKGVELMAATLIGTLP